jgi:hypothetical protein
LPAAIADELADVQVLLHSLTAQSMQDSDANDAAAVFHYSFGFLA